MHRRVCPRCHQHDPKGSALWTRGILYIVEEQVIKKRYTKAVALAIATSASKSDNLNEGYQMITENVQDALDDRFRCTLMSFCTVKASPDYPPLLSLLTSSNLEVLISLPCSWWTPLNASQT